MTDSTSNIRRRIKIHSIMRNRVDKTVQCEACGYARIECLTLHHILDEDGNRIKPGKRYERYLLLCPTCHMEVHKGFLDDRRLIDWVTREV